LSSDYKIGYLLIRVSNLSTCPEFPSFLDGTVQNGFVLAKRGGRGPWIAYAGNIDRACNCSSLRLPLVRLLRHGKEVARFEGESKVEIRRSEAWCITPRSLAQTGQ
jgi:hypothetical protein